MSARRHPKLPGIAAVLGIALSAGAWQLVRHGEERTIRSHAEARALERALAIEHQLAVDVSAVESLAAALAASDGLTRDGFRLVTTHLVSRHRSLRALGWNPRVPAAERAAFEAGENGPPCSITERGPDGTLVPAGDRDAYYAVRFIEPERGNEAAICYDVGSEPRRRAALEEAAATGRLTFSAGVELVQDDAERLGFLAFWPRYGAGPSRPLLGFSVGVFQVADIVREALSGFGPSDVVVRVDDVTEPGAPRRLYDSHARGDDAAAGLAIEAPVLEQGGRRWRIGFVLPPDAVAAQRTVLPLLTLLAGLFATGLTAVYLDVLLQRTRRIEELAAQRAGEIERRERAEAERHRLQAKLQEAQKLESLGVLAGGIAHDFNNLLTTVLGNADLALGLLSSESPARDELDQIRLAATRASELTRQMLVYTGQAHFTPQRIDLARLVEEMAHLLRSAISKSATLRCDLAPDLPPIEGDPSQIRQIVMNLITNASDALGREPGTIDVRLRRCYLAPTDVVGGASPSVTMAGGVSLEVVDTGCGMDDATRARIFDPFFSTKFQGHGLGLAAALGIVRSHRGAIRVTSRPGAGTTITVFFPPATDAARHAAAEDEVDRDPGPASGCILVVDDEEPIRRVAARMLGRLGYRVRTAADGAEAVTAFERNADEIRAIVLDMTMPGISGIETFHALRAIRPDAKILFSSGYDRAQSLETLMDEREIGFLQKPYRTAEMEQALRELLEG